MAKVLVETSARHLHLSQQDLETLFGEGFELTFKKALSQPGQFATNEKVEVIGPKKSMGMISVLGPVRKQTQVELSMTDARSIGIAPFVRESGDLAGTPGCRLVGPKGEIELKEGVIVAKRHIHFTPEDGEKFGVKDKQIVRLKIDSDGRSLVFDDVICRVSPTAGTACHLDTDEANAAGCSGEVYGEVILQNHAPPAADLPTVCRLLQKSKRPKGVLLWPPFCSSASPSITL